MAKLRANYVSNSSSSSFCIVGITVATDKLRDYFSVPRGEFDPEDEEFNDEWFLWNTGEEDLLIVSDEGGVFSQVGFDISGMRDDETLGDYKNLIWKAMKPLRDAGIIKPEKKDDFYIHTGTIWS